MRPLNAKGLFAHVVPQPDWVLQCKPAKSGFSARRFSGTESSTLKRCKYLAVCSHQFPMLTLNDGTVWTLSHFRTWVKTFINTRSKTSFYSVISLDGDALKYDAHWPKNNYSFYSRAVEQINSSRKERKTATNQLLSAFPGQDAQWEETNQKLSFLFNCWTSPTTKPCNRTAAAWSVFVWKTKTKRDEAEGLIIQEDKTTRPVRQHGNNAVVMVELPL